MLFLKIQVLRCKKYIGRTYLLTKGCDFMDQSKGIGGIVFVGCMFIGGGLGTLLGESRTGWLLGMGIGFLGMALVRMKGRN